MTYKCQNKKCGQAFNIYFLPSDEFVVNGNEKFCYPRYINGKKYIDIKCDKCKSINSYIVER